MPDNCKYIKSEISEQGDKLNSNQDVSVVYSIGRHGHRGSYLDLFAEMFGLNPQDDPLNKLIVQKLLRADKLLFATLDDTVAGFALIAVLRFFMGKRTVGIMVRPQSCQRHGKLTARARYWLFRLLSSSSRIAVLSIVPHSLRPGIAAVSNGWVHDPQLWDFVGRSADPDTELCKTIGTKAGARPVLVFVGSITPIKGIKLLAEIADLLKTEILIVIAGKAVPEVESDIITLKSAGALVEDRYVSDQEIEALYQMADMVWCCYRPDYDQASGIFGRASQFGRTALVREESMIEGYKNIAPISMISIPWDNPNEAAKRIREAAAIQDVPYENAVKHSEQWRADFKERVNHAF